MSASRDQSYHLILTPLQQNMEHTLAQAVAVCSSILRAWTVTNGSVRVYVCSHAPCVVIPHTGWTVSSHIWASMERTCLCLTSSTRNEVMTGQHLEWEEQLLRGWRQEKSWRIELLRGATVLEGEQNCGGVPLPWRCWVVYFGAWEFLNLWIWAKAEFPLRIKLEGNTHGQVQSLTPRGTLTEGVMGHHVDKRVNRKCGCCTVWIIPDQGILLGSANFRGKKAVTFLKYFSEKKLSLSLCCFILWLISSLEHAFWACVSYLWVISGEFVLH